MQRTIILSLLAAGMLVLSGCGDSTSPEDQIRAVVAAAEKAAEERDLSDVMALVSDDYQDPRGQSKKDISDLMRGFFILNQSVHLITRVEDVKFPSDEVAKARVVVGMLGRQSQEDWSFAADVYTFDITLILENGNWQLQRADWNRGTR